MIPWSYLGSRLLTPQVHKLHITISQKSSIGQRTRDVVFGPIFPPLFRNEYNDLILMTMLPPIVTEDKYKVDQNLIDHARFFHEIFQDLEYFLGICGRRRGFNEFNEGGSEEFNELKFRNSFNIDTFNPLFPFPRKKPLLSHSFKKKPLLSSIPPKKEVIRIFLKDVFQQLVIHGEKGGNLLLEKLYGDSKLYGRETGDPKSCNSLYSMVQDILNFLRIVHPNMVLHSFLEDPCGSRPCGSSRKSRRNLKREGRLYEPITRFHQFVGSFFRIWLYKATFWFDVVEKFAAQMPNIDGNISKKLFNVDDFVDRGGGNLDFVEDDGGGNPDFVEGVEKDTPADEKVDDEKVERPLDHKNKSHLDHLREKAIEYPLQVLDAIALFFQVMEEDDFFSDLEFGEDMGGVLDTEASKASSEDNSLVSKKNDERQVPRSGVDVTANCRRTPPEFRAEFRAGGGGINTTITLV